MVHRYIFVLIIILGAFAQKAVAQELNISVTVAAPNLSINDPKVLKTMENDIQEFLNTTKWTNDEFLPEERIEGNLQIVIIAENGPNNFVADITIQSIRPVYKSTYKSKLLNYKDESNTITYIENQPIRNSEEKYFDNLSSILTFYAYVIIGLDYDSFSKLGGEQYFNIANNLIQSLPSGVSQSGGWSPANGIKKRSRYWMIENIFNPRLRSMREAYYSYHRKGLDMMFDDPGRGKAVMLSSLKTIEQASEAYPNAMLVQMFSDSKNDEVVDIFLAADRAEKVKVYDIMATIDPYRAGKFSVLKRN